MESVRDRAYQCVGWRITRKPSIRRHQANSEENPRWEVQIISDGSLQEVKDTFSGVSSPPASREPLLPLPAFRGQRRAFSEPILAQSALSPEPLASLPRVPAVSIQSVSTSACAGVFSTCLLKVPLAFVHPCPCFEAWSKWAVIPAPITPVDP